jgi:DNA-binding NarL/FixJ family response regulator/tetratricopeptide (TPR) repeat protein
MNADVIVRPVLCRPFIGRREELAYLRERRLEAGSSRGGVVLIAGDAGVGKSRLIAEFCGSLAYSRWRIAHGPCLEDARRPYGPILDVLARFDAAGPGLAPAATKQEQFDAIVDRLASLASRTALLVVVEDLHWADAATLDLLAYLATRVYRLRVLILASFRPDELHPEHPATRGVANIARSARAGRIDLATLAGVELRTFIEEALTGLTLPDETRRAIALAGDGNPFFTEELLKSAVERDAGRSSDRRRRELPLTLRATLLERLRPFDEGERRVVRQAAVIGRSFGLELLAATLDTEASSLLPTLRRARDFQLVEELGPSTFRFRHGLTREAIYGEFLGAELHPLHRNIALALEDTPGDAQSLEALAYHWWAAGDDARAAHYNELAGDAAGGVHAHEDAIAFYQRALEAKQIEPAVRGTMVERIADRRVALDWTQEANKTYSAAADIFREAGLHEREATCRVRAAITGYTLKLSAPTAPLEEMLTSLEPSAYLARSRIHLGLAWLTATSWFPSQAAHHLAQVDSRALTDAPDIRLRFHNVSAWVAMTVGNLEDFRREHTAWVEAAHAMGSSGTIASAHYNGAMCFSFFGLHDEALENIELALRIARDQRSRHAEVSAHAISALCYVMRGELSLARTALEAVPTTSESRVTVALGTAWGTLAGAHLDDQGLIEKWFDGFEGAISPEVETECAAGFSEIMMRRNRYRDAAALLHRAIPDCEFPRGMVFTLLAAGRYGAPGDRALARTYLARAADGPVELVERHALGLFDAEACLREERSEEATALAREAAAGFRRLRFPLLEAAALETAGEPEAALAIYRRCGARYDVRRIEGRRPAAPASVPHGTGSAALEPSAREREIAMLAAGGQSNVEIARALSISYKTVEKHLGSLYAKLGVSSRTQLAPALGAGAPPASPLFSVREREVAAAVAAGFGNVEIATRLGLSVKTIETHLSRIYARLGLRSRAQLAAFIADEAREARDAP